MQETQFRKDTPPCRYVSVFTNSSSYTCKAFYMYVVILSRELELVVVFERLWKHWRFIHYLLHRWTQGTSRYPPKINGNMAKRYAFQYFSAATIRNVSRGSSVVLNRLRAPRPKDRCSMPYRDKRCFPAKRPHGLWSPPNGVSNGYLGALSWLLKRMGLGAIHLELVLSSRMREVILPLPQVAIMEWSLIQQGHNLTFSLRKVSWT